tara:strand:+ start:1 stop:1914 length:1914 start_codon:yes stop_codon:yes gene_type:complete
MFQTPQMRQGAGIMAGVAPIRGYADGDEVSDDDRSERLFGALSNLVDMGVDKYQEGTEFVGDIAEQTIRGGVNFADIISDNVGDFAYDLAPKDMQTIIDVLGEYIENPTEDMRAIMRSSGLFGKIMAGDFDEEIDDLTPALEEDFFRLTTDSAHKKAEEAGEDTEGVPMNLQDLTDIVFDPDNPVDVGLAALAASPSSFGIGNVAGALGKVGQAIPRIDKLTGSKVSKGIAGLIDNLTGMTGLASRESNPISRRERYGRLAMTAYAPENIEALSNVLTDDEISQSFIDAMEEAEAAEYANGGVATLKARDGIFVDLISGIAPLLGRIAGGAKRTLFGKPKKIDDQIEESLPEPVTEPVTTKTKTNKNKNKNNEENKTETKTDEQQQQQKPVKNVADEVIDEGMKKQPGLFRKTAKYGTLAGTAAGLYWLGNKLIDPETNEEVDVTKLALEDIPPKPQVIDSSVMNTKEDVQNLADELTEENRSWLDKTFSRLRGVAGTAFDKLGDPRVRAGLMAAAKPVEGYTPVNALVAASEGARAYDLEQAQLAKLSEDAKSDLQQQFELIRPLVQPYEGQSEEDVDRMVFQSLFSRVRDAEDIETLLKLNATFPNANINIDDLRKYREALGGVDISTLLSPRTP